MSFKETLNSQNTKGNRETEDICKRVKLTLFKQIYGHGLSVKYVKLLFVILKRQIQSFIENRNVAARAALSQTHQKK